MGKGGDSKTIMVVIPPPDFARTRQSRRYLADWCGINATHNKNPVERHDFTNPTILSW
jgi:hypothetical protein